MPVALGAMPDPAELVAMKDPAMFTVNSPWGKLLMSNIGSGWSWMKTCKVARLRFFEIHIVMPILLNTEWVTPLRTASPVAECPIRLRSKSLARDAPTGVSYWVLKLQYSLM